MSMRDWILSLEANEAFAMAAGREPLPCAECGHEHWWGAQYGYGPCPIEGCGCQGQHAGIHLANVEVGIVFTADIVVGGKVRGFVQKLRRDTQYRAHSHGQLVGAADTLDELRPLIETHFKEVEP